MKKRAQQIKHIQPKSPNNRVTIETINFLWVYLVRSTMIIHEKCAQRRSESAQKLAITSFMGSRRGMSHCSAHKNSYNRSCLHISQVDVKFMKNLYLSALLATTTNSRACDGSRRGNSVQIVSMATSQKWQSRNRTIKFWTCRSASW